MKSAITSAIAAAALALGIAGLARADDAGLSAFDVRGAQTWAEKLVLCDTTAFLASQPDLNADRMWVRRDDGHADLLLPPHFVGGPDWYKEGYERLYWRLHRQQKVDSAQLDAAQARYGRPFVDAYRRLGLRPTGSGFLRRQDALCRSIARSEGEIIS